jgi:uncharacterized protein (DUF924 family)
MLVEDANRDLNTLPRRGQQPLNRRSNAVSAQIEHILDYWFGPLDSAGLCDPIQEKRWFRGGPEVDDYCRTQFGDLVEEAVNGGLADWPATDEGLVALVVLLDQFTRNIYRGKPRAFAGDRHALGLARAAVGRHRHHALPAIHQVFLYLPYEHSEELAIQDAGVALFDSLLAATPDARIRRFRDYAVAHREVIARFGRFPHRNAILGRHSTPEELTHLQRHGGF